MMTTEEQKLFWGFLHEQNEQDELIGEIGRMRGTLQWWNSCVELLASDVNRLNSVTKIQKETSLKLKLLRQQFMENQERLGRLREQLFAEFEIS